MSNTRTIRKTLAVALSAAMLATCAMPFAMTANAGSYWNHNYPGTEDCMESDQGFFDVGFIIQDGKAITIGVNIDEGTTNAEMVLPSTLGGAPLTELGTQTYIEPYNNEENHVLKSITIPDGVKSVGTWAIGTGSTSVIIRGYDVYVPESVTKIDEYAIGYNTYANDPLVRIYGKKGSAAEEYARKYGFSFNDEFYFSDDYFADNATFKQINTRIRFDISTWEENYYGDVYPDYPSDYVVYYKNSNSKNWKKAGVGDSTSIKFKNAGVYDIKVTFPGTEYADLTQRFAFCDSNYENLSYLSADVVEKGTRVKIYGLTTDSPKTYSGEYGYGVFLEPADYYYYSYKNSTSKNWKSLDSGYKVTSASFKPKNPGVYDIRVDAEIEGYTLTKYMKLYVKGGELENNSTINSTEVNAGSRVVMTGSASGGTGVYTYSYLYKRTTSNKWVTLAQDTTSKGMYFTPKTAGEFDVKVIVKDADGTEKEQNWNVTVKGV